MKNDARANEESDRKEKEKVEKINQADSLIFQSEKQLKEYGDKISADKKSAIEASLTKLKEAHKAQDLGQIDTAMTELNASWTAASEEMYKATQAGAQQPADEAHAGNGQGQHTEAGGTENVTDAEFEEVK